MKQRRCFSEKEIMISIIYFYSIDWNRGLTIAKPRSEHAVDSPELLVLTI